MIVLVIERLNKMAEVQVGLLEACQQPPKPPWSIDDKEGG